MIKLKNINKIYISKSKQRVNALKNINLEIADSGMVFVLGKSGSGKSTLLNILGGIDSATSGEVNIDGVNISDFKQKDYDSYRNKHLGFVFQEFNLLNDFNVQDNISIALQLSKAENIKEKVIDALNQVELSSEYLTRRIDELSGGEKQRVAIARAIVKNSKIILADEPTGNLDSSTSESIWKILKNLSKSKLVLVVTHDRESAKQYGDRIIEIADGIIYSDTKVDQSLEMLDNKFSPTYERLSSKFIFRMGINNLLQRKVKAIGVILLAFFTIFALLLMQMTLTFSPEKTFAKFIKNNNVEYIKVTQGKETEKYGFDRGSNLVKLGTKEYIANNSNYIYNGIVEGKQSILDFGLSFIGDALELDNSSWYLTDQKLEELYKSEKSYVMIDGKAVKLVKEFHPIEFLIGKKVDLFYVEEPQYILAGVVDTSKVGEFSKDAFPEYFVLEKFAGVFYDSYPSVNSDNKDILLQFGESNFSDTFHFYDHLTSGSGGGESKILTAEGLKNMHNEIIIAEDEIVLSYEIFAKLFKVQSKWSYVNIELTEVYTLPEQIGSYYDLRLYEFDSGEKLANLGRFKIIGIVFTAKADPNVKFTSNLMFSKNNAEIIHNILKPNINISIQIASIQNLEKFLVDFRQEHSGGVLSIGYETVEFQGRITKIQYSNEIYGFEYQLKTFKIIFLVMAVLLSSILILMVINLISASIINRKKEIGILSALGTSNYDLVKIFMVETVIISTITYILSQIAILIAMGVWNGSYSSNFVVHIPLFLVNVGTFLTPILSSFGLLLSAALLPVRRIAKLKPIDAIKNL